MPLKTPAGDVGLVGPQIFGGRGRRRGLAQREPWQGLGGDLPGRPEPSLRHARPTIGAQPPMSSLRRSVALTALFVCSLTSGCTLAKPVVGAVVGPVVVLGGIGSSGGCYCRCDDGRALLFLLAFGSAIGASAGLVTGIISDVQVLCGEAPDPTHNWWNPLATNTDN